MISFLSGCCVSGLLGIISTIETDIVNGIPNVEAVGLLGASAKEAVERVKAAIRNSGFLFPMKKITINIAPADIRKNGSSFDLPMALGIIEASGQAVNNCGGKVVFAGELSLSGSIKAVTGVLPMALEAKKAGMKAVAVPYENVQEALYVSDIRVIGIRNLKEAVSILSNPSCIDFDVKLDKICREDNSFGNYEMDFKYIKGQKYAKRALEIASCGGHNVLMLGSCGSGKTMLAKCVPSILPTLTYEESIETSIIYSILGLINNKVIVDRPFRTPHYSITPSKLIGGGSYPKPGEISLAHNGVLFLDEITEFDNRTIDMLREPLTDGRITISRSSGTVTFPSRFTLIAASNPCRCGNLYDKNKQCTCSPHQISEYRRKISGAIMDRIDMRIEVSSVCFNTMRSNEDAENSDSVRTRVTRTRQIQNERYKGLNFHNNSSVPGQFTEKYCPLSAKAESVLKGFADRTNISVRGYRNILKVSRTIADLECKDIISEYHVAEAMQYYSQGRL